MNKRKQFLERHPEVKELLEAVDDSEKCDGLPVLRQCADCHEWLDEKSKIIGEHRPKIDFVISHGVCPPCYKKLLTEIIS